MNLGQAKKLQKISSADTSLNQIGAALKRLSQKGTINLDYGGGKFDKGTEYLESKGIRNLIYDPFNRSVEHNQNVIDKLTRTKADTVTVSNVLNVIAEQDAREQVINDAGKYIKPEGRAYFGIYEGNKSGVGKATTKGWQENRITEDYVKEISKYFKSVTRKGNIIEATKPNGEVIKFIVGGTALGASLYSPQAAQAKKYKQMESDQALQDTYSPVDMVIAGATGGATMGLRAISALADPVINFAFDKLLGD